MAAIIVTISLALVAEACGGSSGSHVAQAGAGSSASRGSVNADALRYAQCMRSHGIADFPDPSANGGFAVHAAGPNSDLNGDNPRFQAADRACRGYAPPQTLTPAQDLQLKSEYLRFASCMRSHEVNDFPDPVTGSGGHPGFRLRGGPNSDLNANNPAFRRGVEACQRVLGHQFRFAFSASGVGKGA